ncbi:division/cell wall cluster transcriptional repressor MraZ [Euzebya tangerina]|uniref:division/cell wall cluster transcriptional repressor MraZ n=1 Tax=Euzebya tangerina TaxID=591198 RepID=UPI000E3171E0|nr:division/cell wall cluster transcriptional repressor MraZ [Euzebya tangerina]
MWGIVGEQDNIVEDGIELDDEFLGEFHHSVDAKGRLVLPSDHRSLIGKETIHMTLGFDNIMTIHPPADWVKIRASVGEMRRGDRSQRRTARALFSNASKQTLDKQGRITIPPNLREKCGLTKEVVVVGMGEFIEVWPQDRWESEQGEANDLYVNTDETTGMGSL